MCAGTVLKNNVKPAKKIKAEGMMQERQIAREISYASSAQTRGGRALIKLM